MGSNSKVKPVPVVRKPIIDFFEMMEWINKEYGIDYHDYKNSHGFAREYQELTGIDIYNNPQNYGGKWYSKAGVQCTEEDYKLALEKYYTDSKIYTKWLNEQPKRPYQDYWHWLLQNHFYEVHNPCDEYLSIEEILKKQKTPEWVKEITTLIKENFGEHLDKDGGIEVHISW